MQKHFLIAGADNSLMVEMFILLSVMKLFLFFFVVRPRLKSFLILHLPKRWAASLMQKEED